MEISSGKTGYVMLTYNGDVIARPGGIGSKRKGLIIWRKKIFCMALVMVL